MHDGTVDLDLLDQLLEDDGVEVQPETCIPKRPDPRRSVLSFQQQRLWFLHTFDPKSIAFNVSAVLLLRGRIDHQALSRAVEAIVQRHESLRTRFIELDGTPWQVIDEKVDVRLIRVDLADFEDHDIDAVAAHYVKQPFDLRNGPVLRTILVRCSDDLHVMIVVIHHIVCDGWSVGILLSDFAQFYRSFVAGARTPLEPLTVQYGDYAHWQREQASSEQRDEKFRYWEEKLADLPTIWLPWDRPAFARAGEPEAGSVGQQVSASLTAALQRSSQKYDATLATTLMAAFQTVLHRYSGQTDLPIGMATSNRTMPQIENMVGFFVNMLVVRADLHGTPSFADIVCRARDTMVEALAHADVPFESLVERLRPERRSNRNPLFQVSFVFQNLPTRRFQLPDLEAENLTKDPSARFDLEIFIAGQDEGLRIDWVYDAALFDKNTIEHLAESYLYLLEQVAIDPNAPIDRLRLVRPVLASETIRARERARQSFDASTTLPEIFSQTAARFPRKTALVDGHRRWRYAEVEETTNRMAHFLRAQGVTPGSFVGLYRQRSADMVLSILAILKAGAAYVPVDPMYPADRVRFILDDSRVSWVIADADLQLQVESTGRRILSFAPSDWQDRPSTAPEPRISPDSIAYIIYTSGSTGHPKGCLVMHRNVVRLMRATESSFGFHERDVWTLFHSYAFDFSVWEMWGAWFYGGKLIVVPHSTSRDTEAFHDLVCVERVTVLNQTPSAFATFMAVAARSDRDAEMALRYVIFGGEALDIASLTPWFEHHGDQFPKLVNMYGITETTVHVTYRPLNMMDVHRRHGSRIGAPIADLSIHILDAQKNPVPPGAIGEIYVGGAGVTCGYLDRPDLTQERFITNPLFPTERWYRSGDRGRYVSEHDIEYLGRLDHQVKIRGFRIETGEIRAHLQNMPAIQESVVTVHAGPGGNQLVVYVVPNQPYLTSREQERRLVQQQIDQWQTTFNNIYTQENPTGIDNFNTAGWLQSYTGEQIPDPQMREWLDNTLGAIRVLEPSKVLEVGCGTGMLLLALAPNAKEYVGLDFSHTMVQGLKQIVSERKLDHVELFQRKADELEALRGRTFDTILINSVIQYFPDARYLEQVLRSCVSLLSADGVIFVGDVRNLAHLETYHASVAWERADADTPRRVLVEKVRQAVLHEEELLLDPAFFTTLPTRIPDIRGVVLRAKPGAYPNELNKYRYDVFLCRGDAKRRHIEQLNREPSSEVMAKLGFEAQVLTWLRGAGAGSCRGNAELSRVDAPSFHPLHSLGKPMHNEPVLAQALRRLPVEVRAHLEQSVPDYMIPAHTIVLEALPLTAHGKIDLQALPEPMHEHTSGHRRMELPREGLEANLAEIWCDLLQLRTIDRDAHFFALGGHSLLATQLILRINHRFSTNLALRRIFEEPTLVGFARILEREMSSASIEQTAIPRVSHAGFAPLATGQYRLWLLDQLNPGQSVYNTYQAIQIRGAFDIDALQRALDFIISRHEILRTSMVMTEDRPMQQIHPVLHCKIERRSLGELQNEELAAEQIECIVNDVKRPFALDEVPLLRTIVYEHEPHCCTLVLVAHHIITDGWSLGVMIRELNETYRAYRRHETPSLPPLSIQYADYAHWQSQWLASAAAANQRVYWLRELAHPPVETTLPHDPLAEHRVSAEGALATRRLNPRLSAAILDLCLRNEATLFMTLATALYALLFRATGQSDLILGAPIAQRNHRDLEPLIGFFVNTLALRARPDFAQSFSALLKQVRQTTLAAYAHQDYPFERIVEELVTTRDGDQNPLFQVMLVVQNQPLTDFDWDGAGCVPIELPGHAAKFDLTLFAGETPERDIVLTAEYRTTSYGEEAMTAYLAAYETILEQVVATPDMPLANITLAPLARFKPDRSEAFFSILDRFAKTVSRYPRTPAVEYEGKQLTYEEVDRESNAIARALTNAGVKAESPVAVIMTPRLELLSILLGILKAGAVWMPLDPRQPAARLTNLVDIAKAALVIVDAKIPAFTPARSPVWTLGALRERMHVESGEAFPTLVFPEQLAYIIFTSGSTGTPKGVMVLHEGMTNLAGVEPAAYGTRHGDRLLLGANLTFDASISEIMAAFVTGATLVMVPRERLMPDLAMVQMLRDLAITWWMIRPSFTSLLTDHELPQLRILVFGGERLTPEVVAPWLRSHRRIFNAYGPTETTVCASIAFIEQAKGLVDIGRPIANVSMYVLDAGLGAVPNGVVGELYIGGVGVSRGYLGRPALTAERFVPDPFAAEPGARMYRAGDRGVQPRNGPIVCLGRVDFQIKLRGYRIDPGEIEVCIRQVSDVRDAVVTLHHDAEQGDFLLAHAVTELPVDEAEKRIFAHLREKLPEYMVPRHIVPLRELPLSANGKLDRRALVPPKIGFSAPQNEGLHVSPRTRLEWQVALLFERILNHRPIGIDQNFFELGGHSFLAVRLISEIAREMGVQLPVSHVFVHPTVRGLCAAMETTDPFFAGAGLVPLSKRGQGSPLFLLHQAGGYVHSYFPFVRHLDGQRPIYGLQPAGLDGLSVPTADIVEMARHYREIIQSVQPKGPYYLAGHSLGGVLAYEMARQWTQAGESIAYLGLIDAVLPKSGTEEPIDPRGAFEYIVEQAAASFNTKIDVKFANDTDQEAWLDRTMQAFFDAGIATNLETARRYITGLYRVYMAGVKAYQTYQPIAFAGSAHVYLTHELAEYLKTHNEQQWHQWLMGTVETHLIAGGHLDLLQEPNASTLARIIEEHLAATSNT